MVTVSLGSKLKTGENIFINVALIVTTKKNSIIISDAALLTYPV